MVRVGIAEPPYVFVFDGGVIWKLIGRFFQMFRFFDDLAFGYFVVFDHPNLEDRRLRVIHLAELVAHFLKGFQFSGHNFISLD